MKARTYNIAFTGPECSGKTTLSSWLATMLNWTYKPEFARAYLAQKNTYDYADFTIIAKKQFELNHNIDNENTVSDTEMTVICIWEKEKYALEGKDIKEMALNEKFDLYFLCKPDFEWVQDPLRENPFDRERLFDKYIEQMQFMGHHFVLLYGSIQDRKIIICQTLATHGIQITL